MLEKKKNKEIKNTIDYINRTVVYSFSRIYSNRQILQQNGY